MRLLEKILVGYLVATLLIAGYFGYINRDNLKSHLPLPIKLETKQTLEEQKAYLNGNPFKIQLWINENIRGKSDGGFDFAQLPEETFERRTGDCEDYALLSKYFLEVRYKEIHILVWEGHLTKESKYYDEDRNRWVVHAICVFKIKDGWGIMDNNGFVMIKGTLQDAVRYNCELRNVKVKNAFTARFFHYAYRRLKRII